MSYVNIAWLDVEKPSDWLEDIWCRLTYNLLDIQHNYCVGASLFRR